MQTAPVGLGQQVVAPPLQQVVAPSLAPLPTQSGVVLPTGAVALVRLLPLLLTAVPLITSLFPAFSCLRQLCPVSNLRVSLLVRAPCE